MSAKTKTQRPTFSGVDSLDDMIGAGGDIAPVSHTPLPEPAEVEEAAKPSKVERLGQPTAPVTRQEERRKRDSSNERKGVELSKRLWQQVKHRESFNHDQPVKVSVFINREVHKTLRVLSVEENRSLQSYVTEGLLHALEQALKRREGK